MVNRGRDWPVFPRLEHLAQQRFAPKRKMPPLREVEQLVQLHLGNRIALLRFRPVQEVVCNGLWVVRCWHRPLSPSTQLTTSYPRVISRGSLFTLPCSDCAAALRTSRRHRLHLGPIPPGSPLSPGSWLIQWPRSDADSWRTWLPLDCIVPTTSSYRIRQHPKALAQNRKSPSL